MNYYRRYVGDYLRDTSSLTLLEHGAYNILLDYYYAEEKPLPAEIDRVYRIARAMMPEERRAVDMVLFSYFAKRDDGWHNVRADEELSKAGELIEQMREQGRLRVEARWAKHRKANGGSHTGGDTGFDTGTDTGVDTGLDTPSNHQPPTTKNQPPVKALPANAGSPPILPSNIPYKEIAGLFNELMPDLARVRDLTQARRRVIRSAWQASKRRQSLEFWKRYFEECSEDPFLNGSGPYKPPHENWRPTFDFLMRSDQVTKVYERAMSQAEAK